MSVWRFLGECPSGKSREEIEAQSIDGWNPWREPWVRSMEPDIVVPDPRDPMRWRHAHVYRVERGHGAKFAATSSDRVWFFWIPASASERGAFNTVEPKYEGHWRTSQEEESDLPWPESELGWQGRAAFLVALDQVEVHAERMAYRGLSLCRLCGSTNGYEAFRLKEWEWPAGYRHYVVAHGVRPSLEFETFILAARG